MKIVIIGGGPAGMLAAIAASKINHENIEKVKEPSQVILLEKNDKLGKKLFISGKGRCNLTNNCDEDTFFKNVVRNPKFLYSAFSEFSNQDLKKLVEENGCALKVERGNRVFPVSDKSYDVIDALKQAIKDSSVKVRLNTTVKSIEFHNDISNNNKDVACAETNSSFLITTNSNEKIIAHRVIVATGGLSYPSTGSTGDGYKFAKEFSLKVTDQSPSLVPFEVKEIEDCKSMQGLTLKNVAIKVIDDSKQSKTLYEDFGELLFTHFGLSGPIILSTSCYIGDCESKILSIDLKPALTLEQIDLRLLREFEENNNKKLKSIIELLMPCSMVDVFIDRLSENIFNDKIEYEKYADKYNIDDIGNIKVSDVDRSIRKEIAKLLKDFRFTLKNKRGFDEAIVTRGGVDVKEINPKTMECKKIKGLYFAGEVLDVDALTGGFNIQIACSTGFAAGENANAI